MSLVSRAIAGFVRLAARHSLTPAKGDDTKKEPSRRSGVDGETYAYWYLRRHGWVFVARNYRVPGDRAGIDMVGYDGWGARICRGEDARRNRAASWPFGGGCNSGKARSPGAYGETILGGTENTRSSMALRCRSHRKPVRAPAERTLA